MIVALLFCSNRWSSLCLLPASRQSQHKYAASICCQVIWRDVCHWSARGRRRVIALYATVLWNLYNTVLASKESKFERELAQLIQYCSWKTTFRSILRAYRIPKRSSPFRKNDHRNWVSEKGVQQKWLYVQRWSLRAVETCNEFVEDRTGLEYLRNLAQNIFLERL